MSTNFGTGIDVVAYFVSNFSGKVQTTQGPVRTIAYWPQRVIEFPVVAITKASERWQWISIPAVRRRHYTILNFDMWATQMEDRYSMMVSARSSISASIYAARTSYANLVWWHIIEEREVDYPDLVPPVYRARYLVEVIWDEMLSSPMVS